MAAYIVFLLIVAICAAFGALFPPDAWYASLNKPSWSPPNWVFGPVWLVIYILIATAGWLVWRERHAERVLEIWGLGLVFNAAWPFLFFGLRTIELALVDITLLWMTILAFIWATFAEDRKACLLFIPYLGWVTFAAALNLALLWLNP